MSCCLSPLCQEGPDQHYDRDRCKRHASNHIVYRKEHDRSTERKDGQRERQSLTLPGDLNFSDSKPVRGVDLASPDFSAIARIRSAAPGRMRFVLLQHFRSRKRPASLPLKLQPYSLADLPGYGWLIVSPTDLTASAIAFPTSRPARSNVPDGRSRLRARRKRGEGSRVRPSNPLSS